MAKMPKNNSTVAARKAVPGGVKADASFNKRQGAKPQKMDAGRAGPREQFGVRLSANAGKVTDWTTPTVSDDNAGTRSRADLPPETVAMKAPPATLPAAAADMASPTLPVCSADTPLFTVTPWDCARDTKLGREGS